eukprot:238041-Pyramimonas_sp.AAC.1
MAVRLLRLAGDVALNGAWLSCFGGALAASDRGGSRAGSGSSNACEAFEMCSSAVGENGGVGDALEALGDGGLDLPAVVAPRALQRSGDGVLVAGGVAKFAVCASPLCRSGRR